MLKSITELYDQDLSKFMQSNQNLDSKSNITYNGFVRSDVKQSCQPSQKHMKITRSHNISPSIGQYNVSYKCLDIHKYEVNFGSPRTVRKPIEEMPRTVRVSPFNNQIKQHSIKGGIDFEKQVSREQMYLIRGWLKFDKSMRAPKRTLEEKLHQLEVGQEALLKFPSIEVKENPQLQMKVSHLPHDYEKIRQISRQYLQKYHIKESALRFYSP
ncbi:unnamed protein product [Paramecium pentaurelia]|uniref:Uncharacterized protein n=1 Tax=Paramecium pentaurelia TaxID=43138 RepID=A0A8S1Y4J0_9CILI|nr:unnamed protein product [Paramecium pentaurelia]